VLKMTTLNVDSVSFQDVRCFHGETEILLRNPTIFVGGNDSGKSSIFKILDIFFNKIEVVNGEEVRIDKDFVDFLWPKFCERKHSSKRIWVEVSATDGRLLRGMTDNSTGTAFLILTITRNGVKLELNENHRRKVSDKKAIKLYERLRQYVSFTYVPSLRDVSGTVFSDSLKNLFGREIFERIFLKQVGGTTREYRNVKEFATNYKGSLKSLANSYLLKGVKKNLPIPVSEDIEFDVDASEEEIVEWFLKHIKIVRPAQEGEAVDMLDIGTGVLSSLSLAVLLTDKVIPKAEKVNIIAIEEPEAFVHPHFQRSLFHKLLRNVGKNLLLVSTHSPAIIDRRSVENISIVTRKNPEEGSKVWQIGDVENLAKEIFSAHANFPNSELFFSDLVILVEGPSEKFVLNHLFSKLPEGIKDLFFGISIIEVGSNTHFGPFIRLLRSFSKTKKEFPISWLVFSDRDSIKPGGDQPLVTALRDSGYTHLDFERIRSLSSNFRDEAEGLRKIKELNKLLLQAKCFVNLADLEHSLLNSQNFSYIKKNWEKQKTEGLLKGDFPSNLGDALSYIGSKGLNLDKQPSETAKKPFIHGKIMKATRLKDISPIFKDFIICVAKELNVGQENLSGLKEKLGS